VGHNFSKRLHEITKHMTATRTEEIYEVSTTRMR